MAKTDINAQGITDTIADTREQLQTVKERKSYVPFSATSFSDVDALEKAAEKREELLGLMDTYLALSFNIFDSPDIQNPANALDTLTKEFIARLAAFTESEPDTKELLLGDIVRWNEDGELGIITGSIEYGDVTSVDLDTPLIASQRNPVHTITVLAEGTDGLYRRTTQQVARNASMLTPGPSVTVVKMFERSELKELGTGFTTKLEKAGADVLYSANDFVIYKDSSGVTRFYGIYSNKYKDLEDEIIAEAAHKDFIAAVEAKEVELPELQLWHIPAPIGEVKNVIWSEYGFVIATGEVYKEFAPLVDKIVKTTKEKGEQLGMSFGFYVLGRDKNVITKYKATEVSFLPLDRAANRLTGIMLDS